jgi:ubiquitin-protein ligase
MCYFVIHGCSKEYKGGKYFGHLEFPELYPMAPPKIFFSTPSGRFEVGSKICVSFRYERSLFVPFQFLVFILVAIIILNFGTHLGESNLS